MNLSERTVPFKKTETFPGEQLAIATERDERGWSESLGREIDSYEFSNIDCSSGVLHLLVHVAIACVSPLDSGGCHPVVPA